MITVPITQEASKSKHNYVLRTIGSGVIIAESTLSDPGIDAGDGVFTSLNSPAMDVGDFVIGYQGTLKNQKQFSKLQKTGTFNGMCVLMPGNRDVTEQLVLQ
jgi:hypothetical protein